MESMEMEKNIEQQPRPEMSDMAVSPEGNLENAMDKRIADAIASAHKTLEGVDAEGGIETVVAEAEKKTDWDAKILESLKKQGFYDGSSPESGAANGWEELKQIYFRTRRFIDAKFK